MQMPSFRRFGMAPVSPHRTAQGEANACRNGCGRPDLERSGHPEYGATFRSNGRERYISYARSNHQSQSI